MSSGVFEVVRIGRKWGVAAEGQVMALTASRRSAEDLARNAAKALDSGAELNVGRRFVRPEPRSFRDD